MAGIPDQPEPERLQEVMAQTSKRAVREKFQEYLAKRHSTGDRMAAPAQPRFQQTVRTTGSMETAIARSETEPVWWPCLRQQLRNGSDIAVGMPAGVPLKMAPEMAPGMMTVLSWARKTPEVVFAVVGGLGSTRCLFGG